MSRVGSLVSLVRVMIFVLILVERLASQRALIRAYYQSRRREWKWSLLPSRYHGLSENSHIFLWGRKNAVR